MIPRLQSIEQGDDSGAPLVLTTDAIAQKFVQYYWRQVVPYATPGEATILQQNTARQAAIVNLVRDARASYGDSLTEGEKLFFLPVPEPDTFVGQKPSAVDQAKAIGWPTSFDLDDVGKDPEDTTLAVLHYVEQLETLTRKIGSAAKTAIKESGANML